VVSGAVPALEELAAACAGEGIRTRVVPVDYASHCAQVEAIREEVLGALAAVVPGPARIPMMSAMTGRFLDGADAGAGYWYESLRSPVRFSAAVGALAASGHGVFAEISPHPVLTSAITETLEEAGAAGPVVTGTLRRGDGGPRRVACALGAVFTRGVAVDWAAVLGSGRRVELPVYAFEHQRYWLTGRSGPGDAAGLGQAAAGHPLAGAAVELPGTGGVVLTGRISLALQPWLADHVVAGRVLVPGAALAELAVRAGAQAGCGRLEELVIEAPLPLPERGGVRVQVMAGAPDESGRRTVAVYAQREAGGPGGPWTRHAAGSLAPDRGGGAGGGPVRGAGRGGL
jgi:acyl transferase domain-containing protein